MIDKKASMMSKGKGNKNFQFEVYDDEEHPGLNHQVVEEIEDYLNQQDALDGTNPNIIDDEDIDYEYHNIQYSGARGLLAEMEEAVDDGDLIDPEVQEIIHSANHGNKILNNGYAVSTHHQRSKSFS